MEERLSARTWEVRGNGDVMTEQSASYGAEAHQVRGFEAKPHLSPVADSPGKDYEGTSL